VYNTPKCIGAVVFVLFFFLFVGLKTISLVYAVNKTCLCCYNAVVLENVLSGAGM